MVPSYPAVLFAYRQHCRFVQAEATTLPAMKTVKKSFPTFYENMSEMHELGFVCTDVGMLVCVWVRQLTQVL